MPSSRPGRALAALRHRLTYADVMATVAVFLALGGGAYAAVRLPADSVGSRQIRAHAVTKSRLAPTSVGTAQITRNGVTLNRLSAGVRSLLAQKAAGKTGPAGVQGATGAPGSPGAPGTRSSRATGTDNPNYTSGSALASLPVSEAGLHILFASLTVANNGPDHVSGGCGLTNGARQLQAGNGVDLDPGATATLSLPGLDEVRDTTQPVTLACQLSGTGPVAVSAITLRGVRLEG